MDNVQNLEDLKKSYKNIKNLGDTERLEFLDSIVLYCEHIGFTFDKIMFILALIRNVTPEPGQKFTECDGYDDIDIEFNKKITEKQRK